MLGVVLVQLATLKETVTPEDDGFDECLLRGEGGNPM